ncbi:MAG: valine--tRNA ligase [Oscillospiraceae bacterium]|jgi:valyl-tRNA synthetase|nr:valine--tRNA ligase [Oscillospiraceae bacterium]
MSNQLLNKQYNSKEIENKWYQFWVLRFFYTRNETCSPTYTIMMPPPNITGRLHMGHALDNTLQDIIIRFKRMQGFNVLWVPGTDHAAIATEAKIVAKIREEGQTKEQIGREEFLKKAFAWQQNYGGQIVEQIKKLGCSCDWNRERFTMDDGCNEAVATVFVDFYNRGLIYKAKRIVNWCPTCKTSISDAEVTYEERDGNLWEISYDLVGGGEINIATTRPETIFGDTAIAVHPKDERFRNIIGKTALVPFINRPIPIIADESVLTDFGTGALKITPFHKLSDFEIGQRHKLPGINTITLDGKLNENAGNYAGLNLNAAREAIIADLSLNGKLITSKSVKHNVGVCYRCGTTIEPLALTQWFIKMNELVQPAIDVVKNKTIKFIPERFENIYFNWLENIQDWCISRQLWWGHRIPAYYCEDCSYMAVSKEDISTCPACSSKKISQDEDTLDTWFSSALWPFSALGWPQKTEFMDKFFPTQTLVTGYDIIFFWVARMIFTSLDQTKQPPFKHIYIHGLVRDEQGRKMSKSLGNGIDPIDIVEKNGADVLRMALIIGVSPGNDSRFSEKKLLLARNFINKIWNASRFILMNLPNESKELTPNICKLEDKWIIGQLNRIIQEVTANIENFEFGIALQKIYDFSWNIFCAWYIELAKIRIKNQDSQVLGVLIFAIQNILKLLHPFLPFVTEELWQTFPHTGESIMIQPWCESDPNSLFTSEVNQFEKVISVVKAIRNARAENKIPQNQKIKLYIETTEGIILNSSNIIQALCSVKTIFFNAKEINNSETLVVHTETAKIFISVSANVNKSQEIQRLTTALEKSQKEYNILKKRLVNKEIWEKAPDVAQKYKKTMEKISRQIANIEASMQQVDPH